MKRMAAVLGVIMLLGIGPAFSYAGEESVYLPWTGEYRSVKGGDKASEYQATKIIGTKVQNAQGDYLGKITDLMIDPQNGRIAFAVLSRGGILGIPTRFVAVPFGALTSVNEKEYYFLDVTKEKMAAAPSFGRDQWPDVGNRQWGSENYRYFGQTPYWEE